MKSRRNWMTGAAGAMLALALCACDRNYESAYLPGSGQYAGDEWTRDTDGDGVADSVAKYFPDCGKDPRTCVEDAKVVSRLGTGFHAVFGDMILWQGTQGALPQVTWMPEEASVRGYRLYSSDTAKVRIRDGRMDAVGVGNAQITAVLHGESRTWSFLARVVAAGGRKVLGISAGDLAVEAGGMAVPDLAWNPPDADHKDYTLNVDDPSVAWAQGGSIKAVAAGTARVTVVAQDGGHKALFTLKVTDALQRIEAASIAADDMYLVVGDTDTPEIRWNPHNVTEKRYLLAPADTTVATVDRERDRIVAKSPGRTQVNVYSLDGGNKSTYFTVSVAATAVPLQALSAADMKLAVGSSPAFPRLAFTPAEATNRKFRLVSDSPHVAHVDGNLIVPAALGLATLRAIADDGGLEAPFLVQVRPQDTAIHVDSVRAHDISLTAGYERTPLLTWYPEDAGNQAYSLVSADPGIASIDGVTVRGIKGGNTTVTVTADDGGKTAAFRVNVVSVQIPVQRVQGQDMDMVAGDIESPSISWYPANVTDRGFSLASDNPSVARVLDSSAVEALAVGTARVFLRSKEGPADTLQVTVNARPIPVTGIAVPDMVLNVGDPDKEITGLIQWTPGNATDKSYLLAVSGATTALAVVDNKLRAAASGTARVVVESQDAARLKDTITVVVRQPVKGLTVRDTSVWPASADIDPSNLIAWNPSNADNKEFTMTSLDTAVAAVIGGNRVRPRASGSANVVLKSLENPLRLDTFKVIVMVPVKSVTVRDTTVYVGMRQVDPVRLVTWNPSNAADKRWYLQWAGTPAGSVLDSVNWRFNAVGPGKVNLILFSSQNPAARDTFAVTVIQPVTGLTAGPLQMKVGDPDAAPLLTWAPQNASDKGYTLASGNTGVATASAGKVHAVGPGTATFTARSNDGGKVANFTVTVTQPVTSITAANLRLIKGGADMDPVITWNPANASNKGFSLSGGNASIAIVAGAKVRPVGAGTATFTVTTTDGSKTASFTATVTVPVIDVGCEDASFRIFDLEGAIVITWNPSDATNKNYSLVSSDPTVLWVEEDNRVSPLRRGDVTLTVTSEDGNKQGTCFAEVR